MKNAQVSQFFLICPQWLILTIFYNSELSLFDENKMRLTALQKIFPFLKLRIVRSLRLRCEKRAS